MKKLIFLIVAIIITTLHLNAQTISLTSNKATIENSKVAIEFNLKTGTYSGVDKKDNTIMFKDATFLLDPGQKTWRIPKQTIRAEEIVDSDGKQMRVWFLPEESYDPQRFLDFSIQENSPVVVIGWGVKNTFAYEIRVRQADVLFQGKLFEEQQITTPKALRGGAGSEPNFVENTWKIKTYNSAMLTYNDAASNNSRRTIVVGGLKYAEFLRELEIHEGEKKGTAVGDYQYIGIQPYITLSISDPQGKRIPPNETWTAKDNYFVDFTTTNPFESLENYGRELAKANNANPNRYNFPTLCGWAVSNLGQGVGKEINNSPGLVEQMEMAKNKGLNKYTSLAVRLEPDYYCYNDQGNTQQGWWDDEHWSKYGSLKYPYETFSKFSNAIREKGGQVFTYFQGSMPSNDFAIMHPDWMLNDDISLIHTDHFHQAPLVRYDFTNPEFQQYVLKMWTRLRDDGVIGIKFDYPETAWARNGGFDDKTYTTVSAYRKLFALCRDGMGKDAFIHERNLGARSYKNAPVPRLDCTVGIVDIQRSWTDASHFEPEMASRIGLRWYKQGVAFRYYPDSKSFYSKGKELSSKDRRTFLTLVGLLSGRLELATGIGNMTDEMIFDLTRLYPVLPNGKSFRPVDFLLEKKHPEIYVYDVNDSWKQVILINNDFEYLRTIIAPISGDQVTTGSIGFKREAEYIVFDFWNQKTLGVFSGKENISKKLQAGEALIFSVKELQAYPQIIGTNRHVMCGMFEITNEEWDEKNNILKFNADIIAGETMKISIHLPEDKELTFNKISVKNAESFYSIEGNQLVVSLLNEKENVNAQVEVKF